jgi:hypothetical protein
MAAVSSQGRILSTKPRTFNGESRVSEIAAHSAYASRAPTPMIDSQGYALGKWIGNGMTGKPEVIPLMDVVELQ